MSRTTIDANRFPTPQAAYGKPVLHDDGDVVRNTKTTSGPGNETNIIWGQEGPVKVRPRE